MVFPTVLSNSVYYRCAVTCGLVTVYSDTVEILLPAPHPGGIYTINSAQPTGSNNFQSFSDAVNAIKCGITSSITFDVAPNSGPYNEQITLPQTIGSDVSKTVTINGNGNTLSYDVSQSPAVPHVLGISGSDHITVRDLIIKSTGVANGFAVHLWDGADNDSFINCTLEASVGTASSLSYAAFVVGGSSVDYTAGLSRGGNNNVLLNCTLNRGYYGAAFIGKTSTDRDTGNKVIDCNVKNFYNTGIYGINQYDVVFSANTVERPDSAVGSFNGIHLTGTPTLNALIEKNTIRYPYGIGGTGTAYGIYINGAATAGNETKVYNNLLHNFEGNGTQYGLYISAAYAHVYHNTVVLDNASSTSGTTRGIYATTGTGQEFKNNNIYITRGGGGTKYCIYFTGGSQLSDYNNFYINAAAGSNGIGYYSGAKATLANWQGANTSNAWDVNSISVDPVFTTGPAGAFEPTATSFNDLGTPLMNVTEDIYGNIRAVSPDMGAVENSTYPLSLSLDYITAKNVDTRNKIEWQTSSEEDVHYFDLERSFDGKDYKSVFGTNAKGVSGHYDYWDATPATGTNYYRLKVVSTSGKFTLSKRVSATVVKDRASAITAFPNPATDKLTLQVIGKRDINAHVEIVDLSGKKVFTQQLVSDKTDIDTKTFANGIYFIHYKDDTHTEVIKIIKN